MDRSKGKTARPSPFTTETPMEHSIALAELINRGLQLVNISNGGFLSQDGQAVALVHREDETTGTLQITATRPPGAGGVSGQGAVVTMTFQAKASGQTPLTITRGGARDPGQQAITVNGAQASVTVQ